MTSASLSVRPGAGVVRQLGVQGRWLLVVGSFVWLGVVGQVRAESKAESREPPVESSEAANTAAGTDAPSGDRTALEETAGDSSIRRIGPVTTITEVSSGLPFPARVDTGATKCSIHYEAMEIEDEAESPADNVGKRVRILIKSPDGKQEWVDTKIVDYVTVRTSNDDDERYEVRLKLRWQDVEKQVRVTLKDRERMKYPLLVGRNFLRGDFLVDVNLKGE